MNMVNIFRIICFFILICSIGCRNGTETKQQALFTLLDHKRTGLHFSNNLKYTREFNLFKYIYFYNGSGVGAGDFNNDGRIDLFFGSNQGQNKFYVNEGGLKFTDRTREASIPDDGGWSTGISVVDINNDGLLDIYVCRVGQYETLRGKNQLLINSGPDSRGIPVFEDKAAQYGLDFSGFSSQSAFFDYDNDGDLDMYLLNHSVHENGTFRPRQEFNGTMHALSGDRIYRNDGTIFTDVTRLTGINSSAIGYGLGISVSDINLDGYPDIYIGNDFHENDYLYINQKNGTFREEGVERMMHTSQFSMGVDAADVNNDAYPEIISLDMLPSDPYMLKRSLGEDAYDIFHYKMSVGYAPQYARNNFQFNRKDGRFSEVGLYGNIAATDWSWAPLWMDFDNDGLKDLFISNGIPKRMNDIDYINFVSNGEVQQKIRNNTMEGKDLSLIEKFPQIKLPNRFYRNSGNLVFSDEDEAVDGNVPTFSNGAAYADLDNDGDLDIIVSNIDDPVIVYENRAADSLHQHLELKLQGSARNRNAVGSMVVVFSGGEKRTYEHQPARGFLSSMLVPLHIGLKNTTVDSMVLIWPDRTFQHIRLDSNQRSMSITYKPGSPLFDFAKLSKGRAEDFSVDNVTGRTGLQFLHRENHFVEFDREPLIPHMVSTEGPAVAIQDINGDGLDDVFLGSARNRESGIFLQQSSGKFLKLDQPAIKADSSFEDVSACWADLNKDGHTDLVVASGGNEFYGRDSHNTPRVYMNDGQMHFTRAEQPFDTLFITASVVLPLDFNKDGFIDLFLGGRAVPWAYGECPRSYLLQNNGKGKFTDVTQSVAADLRDAGFVTDARLSDLDGDGDEDLLLALEWDGLVAFIADKNGFTKKQLTDKKGWWNFILPFDADGDGDLDLVAGNLGWNSRLKASTGSPVRLYYNDFDGNGKKEQLLTYFLDGKEVPFANKAELEKQIPAMKKKFLYAEDFAKSSLTQLFDANKLNSSRVWTADYFSNALLINTGNLNFEVKELPWQVQLSCFKDGVVINANNDNLPDLFLAGNYYDNNIQMGRYDADFGTILVNRGGGNFEYHMLNIPVKGQVRHIRKINLGKNEGWLIARNNDSTLILQRRN